MSQPFSFPPPPPPPPRRDNPVVNDSRGGFRGRSHSRAHFPRGSNPSYRSRGSYNNHNASRGRGYSNYNPHAPKRDFATAFTSQSPHPPTARPAVPDFNVDIQKLLPDKAPTTKVEVPKRKNNILGLTPVNADASESEDDADDEARLAGAANGEGIQFQHRGQTLSLRSPAEIAAWIAERKKKFPTKAKQEVAKREAEERRQQLEEQKKAREAALRSKKEARDQMRNERERQKLKEKLIAAQVAKAKSALATSKEDATLQAKLKAEKLRKKAERAAQQLRSAEEQLQRIEQDKSFTTDNDAGTAENKEHSESGSDSLSSDSDMEDTSSSGSSDIDSGLDSGPEEATSKHQTSPYQQKPRRTNTEDQIPCKNFMNFGRCKYGRKCRFSHKIRREAPQKPTVANGRRKGLYQVMVEKELSEQQQHTPGAAFTSNERGLIHKHKVENNI